MTEKEQFSLDDPELGKVLSAIQQDFQASLFKHMNAKGIMMADLLYVGVSITLVTALITSGMPRIPGMAAGIANQLLDVLANVVGDLEGTVLKNPPTEEELASYEEKKQ